MQCYEYDSICKVVGPITIELNSINMIPFASLVRVQYNAMNMILFGGLVRVQYN